MDGLLNILEIIIAVITINGVIFGIFHKFVKDPLQKKYNAFCIQFAHMEKTTNDTNYQLTEHVVPFMNSFQKEFSTNSGKSIKDCIVRIDNAIKREELKNKLMADNITTVGAYECNHLGECVWVNKTLCKMFGLTHEEMLGRGWLNAVCEEDRTPLWKKWIENVELDIPYDATYSVCNKQTGKTSQCHATAVRYKDASGDSTWFYGTVTQL